MSFHQKFFSFFIQLNLVIASPQINLHFTDLIDENKSSVVFQHDCLYVAASIKQETDPYQIISYCLTEWSSKWDVQENNLDQKYTFLELYKQNITSQQLYFWSAPIDVIERYQLYLNQFLTSNNLSSIASQVYYNCTLPRFGPLCQYSLDIYDSRYSSLNEMIYNFYQQQYKPMTLTCYTHLKCNRGSTLACLDWTEICDGYIDCLNDGIDENNCWQVEINECKDNEYRCYNGQCISMIFFHDSSEDYECLDLSDELPDSTMSFFSFIVEPTFSKEDIKCSSRHSLFGSNSLTSSCGIHRHNLLKEIMFLDIPNSLSKTCWLAFKCNVGILNLIDPICSHLCPNRTCKQTINETCPDLLFMPSGALAFGHVYLAYLKQNIVNASIHHSPQYICYNDQLCGGFYSNITLLKFNNTTCRRPEDFPVRLPAGGNVGWLDAYLRLLYGQLYQCNTIIYNDPLVCNSPTMYRCINSSKCISKHRLCDNINDCDYKDDEQCSLINGICSTSDSETLFKCPIKNLCISLKRVGNRFCECGRDEYDLCDDEISPLHYIRKHISFPTICDGFTELAPVMIAGRNETDETECEYWQCNNTYTRCDNFWNCFDGADEIDCDPSPLLKCPLHHHICVSPKTYQLMCLPLEKAHDGTIDCIGSTDEPKLCRANNHHLTDQNFYCKSNAIQPCTSFHSLCYRKETCMHGDNEPLCNQTRNNSGSYSICSDVNSLSHTNVQTFLCGRQSDTKKSAIVHFSIDQFKQITIQDPMTRFIPPPSSRQYDQRCHRGLPLRIWSNYNENLTTITCLCPPSFYGDRCQYQNQRVSLTLQFQTFSDSTRTLFALIVSLIDDSDERIIHSYQQLTYLYIEHCRTKFNIYLLYSTRPKLSTKNYSIHIDIYEKLSFAYRGSLLIPLQYPFLPVHRIAVQLNIPRSSTTLNSCSNQQCIHGRCMTYSDNKKDIHFCQCNRGWSGKYCTISHTCTCSSDSLCVGVSANNRSICVCPLNKWGYQCLLQSTLYQFDQNTITCHNGGQYISIDENLISDKQFICMCLKGFSGKRCEISDSKLIVSFQQDIDLPQTMLVHFIRIIDNDSPEIGSTFKTISPNQKSVTILWARPFHIVLVELFHNNFYLITIQTAYNQSATIIRTINSSDRCKHISEVLNGTITKFHLLRRIKYYHIPCQRRSSPLSCFYDDTHFCLCNDFGHHRVANCFEFNYTIQHDCFGQSNCENGAQCLQDRLTCPQTSTCVCPKCFYGTRCQFSSDLFDLSLDAILGYHILPHISIKHQPSIVQVSVVLTTIVIIAGLINGILSLITFKNKMPLKVGSGLYLLGSTITTLLIVTMLGLKFSILIVAQMTYITNQSFLKFQCTSIDFLLRICLTMDQWLKACVAMERVMTIIKRTGFNKQKSKQIAKYIILFLLLLTVSTTIHDPIHRRLIDDVDNDEEKRIWCIVTFSSSLQTFNLIIHIFHFLIPFIINLVSAVIIIKKAAQQRTRIRTLETYRRIFYEQFQRHIHLFLAPLLLTILAVPRLIISFTSGCMKSNGDSWLFLSGYYISFIPPTLTFVIFIIPSKFYKEEFYKSIKQYRRKIQTRIHPIS